MPDSAPPPAVRHNAAAHRYETVIDGRLAECDYESDAAGRIVYTHTFVPPELRGRGVAEALVRAALADAKDRGARVVPACSYVASFIARHPEYQSLVA